MITAIRERGKLTVHVHPGLVITENSSDQHHYGSQRENSLSSKTLGIENADDHKTKKAIVVDSSTSTQSEDDRMLIYGSSQQGRKLTDIMEHANFKSKKSIACKKKRRSKETIETKRERKAWRTLAIITGTFVACWTPFFLVSLYRPICQCTIPKVVETVTAWLGYLNSALNPIIYTVFSQDFRAAFKKNHQTNLFSKRIVAVTS
ncbi:hypothetical protein DICVIV_08419 [Dictyocaulus viviparus]|uniref:G-protein coupled receptors family 1 profile domain-containing protein n=1 Tax=Dictyocaulus viviparus TaxID=29172 RepID=A0A0D8XT30_DICVI|nr:hypothetical protein DICVIV_08419 [Dictyocaulus viviparus]